MYSKYDTQILRQSNGEYTFSRSNGGRLSAPISEPEEELGALDCRDTYLEQHQTEKLETEVTDADRIRITEVYACCTVWPSGGVIRMLLS
jgi:hypothetical protein